MVYDPAASNPDDKINAFSEYDLAAIRPHDEAPWTKVED
jgi:hypothetical protein